VRIALVALTFFGGTGLVVYGLAWLLIPAEGEDRSLAQQWSRDVDGWWRIAGVAAVILGGALLAGALGNGRLIAPLLLLAAGAWLLVRSGEEPDGETEGETAGAEPVSAQPAPVSSPDRSPSPPTASTAIALSPSADVTEAGPAQPVDPTVVRASGPPPGPDRPARPSPFLTPLVLAVVMLIGGLSVLAARAELFSVSVSGVLALCLLVVGIALLVSVRWGRARGLIPLGFVLAAGIGLASLFSFPLWSGVGERIVVADDVSIVEEPIHHGIGVLDVDMSDLDLDGSRQEVEIGLSIGELVVTVPPDVNVEVTGAASAGSLVAFDEVSDGLDRTLTAERLRGGTAAGTLVLDLEVGFGQVRVEVG
jgi:hypothetical protein